jgi:hypothetical protein
MKPLLAASFLLLAALTARAEVWQFGLIGDVPYSDRERAALPKMLASMQQRPLAFIAHIGDIKHGGERCDDAVFRDRFDLFNATKVPFVFIPGDNEWSDCDRLSNGAYYPQERLEKLRTLFWSQPRSLGQQPMALTQQPGKYPEHARFRLGPVLFITLNLPGGNNNWGPNETPGSELRERMPAVLAWLDEGFQLARQEKLAGVVVMFQANPGFKHFAQKLSHRGYRSFLERLREHTDTFGGKVVAVHGDSHLSRIDQPLRNVDGKRMRSFTRVETFGYPLMGWTLGVINTNDPELFRFETYPWPAAGQPH